MTDAEPKSGDAAPGPRGEPVAAHRLSDLTWPRVSEAVVAGATTVILPLGATEQHGPHLPLGTDTIRATALAERLATHLPGALVAPALPFGCSDEHAGFPGLMGLDAETLAAVIVDCARRLVEWGVRALVVVSAHGGNGRGLRLAGERLRHELPGLRVWLADAGNAIASAALRVAERDGVPPEVFGLHAGEGETSELLHLCPDLVKAPRVGDRFTGEWARLMPVLREVGVRPISPSGVLGDPSIADALRGARYLDAVARELAGAIHREAEA